MRSKWKLPFFCRKVFLVRISKLVELKDFVGKIYIFSRNSHIPRGLKLTKQTGLAVEQMLSSSGNALIFLIHNGCFFYNIRYLNETVYGRYKFGGFAFTKFRGLFHNIALNKQKVMAKKKRKSV